MAKVKSSGFGDFAKFYVARTRRIVRQTIAEPRVAKMVKGLIVRNIQLRQRLPSDKRVKNLAASTVRSRRRLAENNKTSRFYAPAKSNLTFTGRFLRSLEVRITKGKKVKYTISPQGKHLGYKNANGSRGKPVDNADIGRGLVRGGRDYTVVGPKTNEQISEIIRTQVLNAISRKLKL